MTNLSQKLGLHLKKTNIRLIDVLSPVGLQWRMRALNKWGSYMSSIILFIFDLRDRSVGLREQNMYFKERTKVNTFDILEESR